MNTLIFPPSGPQNAERFGALNRDAREQLWFSLEFCDAVLQHNPTHRSALELAATCCTELGYYEDGLRLDRELSRLLPGDPLVLYNLACSLALTGCREEALSTLGAAISRGSGHGAIFHNMRKDNDLYSIRNEPRFIALASLAACLA